MSAASPTQARFWLEWDVSIFSILSSRPQQIIAKAMSPRVRLIDSAEETAHETARMLSALGLRL